LRWGSPRAQESRLLEWSGAVLREAATAYQDRVMQAIVGTTVLVSLVSLWDDMSGLILAGWSQGGPSSPNTR